METPQEAPVVRLIGLRKSFGGVQVLRSIGLDLERGKTTVVMGPSGCGKSVMLKHIVGLLKPDEGEVWFDETRIDGLSERALIPHRLRMGLLFQMAALFDSMTVEENVAFPLIEHRRMTKAERRDRVAEALKRVDLDGTQHQLPAELSGGQRKRVGLARATVLEPALILYDEPTTGLDPIRADGIDRLVCRFRDELGMTGLVVTHDLTSAQKVGDRFIVLLDGEVAAQGSWDEVAAHDNPRVRRFLAGEYHADDIGPAIRLNNEEARSEGQPEAASPHGVGKEKGP
ncbi:MAG: ABC transporter ATP-binding protein [Planctomycetota bacterium]